MPQSPTYRHSVVVAAADIDELGHASNLVYLRWVLDIAREHSRAVGYHAGTYREIGGVFVVRRHEIDYLRPALEADELQLETWIESWKGASSLRQTNILRKDDGATLARAVTNWAFVSLESGRPQRMPQALKERFARLDA